MGSVGARWEVETLARVDGHRPDGAGFLVGLDATPTSGSHSIRGIGRYTRGIVNALITTQPEWCGEHLGLLTIGRDPAWQGVRALRGVHAMWRTRRSTFRPQDVGWLVSGLVDRTAGRRRGVDLWHETDPANPLGIGGSDGALVTAYDLIPLLEPEVMSRIRFHRRLPYRLYLRRLRSARAVLAISQATADDVHSVLGVPETRIHVVHPAVAALRTAGPVADAEPALLFVGVPDPHKRPELAIEALAAYKGRGGKRPLVFVGHHPADARARLQKLADARHVGSQVRFMDRVDDGTLAGLYRNGILLAVSRREGFGLPPVECLLTGGRAVATPEPIYREVLGSATVFAVDDSAEAIAEAVGRAEDQPPEPAEIAWLADRYSPASTAVQLISVYEAVLRT